MTQILKPEYWDERADDEMTVKGFANGFRVVLDSGHAVELSFIDPVRLRQDLESEIEQGHPYFWEPNLVVIPEVTMGAIQAAVEGLSRDGTLDALAIRSIPGAAENSLRSRFEALGEHLTQGT